MRTRQAFAVTATLVVMTAAALVLADVPGGDAATNAQRGVAQPNVLVVMTDDQRLDELKVMKRTRRALGRRGLRFEQAVATYPLCCPSRASYLTGQYAHNHGVLDNRPPLGGVIKFNEVDDDTLATRLDAAGYRTGWIGKYLNGYQDLAEHDPPYRPPGWDAWLPVVVPKNLMYGWTQVVGSERVRHGNNERDYQTDVLARQAERFIRGSVNRDVPFFLTVATSAPHIENPGLYPGRFNPRPARRHRRALPGLQLEWPPSFAERNVRDKPSFVRRLSRLRPANRFLRDRRLARLRSLLAVDEMVGSLVRTLRRKAELGNTLVVFTSDNGMQLGEHRLRSKSHIYEESLLVPLLVRGPGLPASRTVRPLAANIDLAPTILETVGVAGAEQMDGVSLAELARRPEAFARRSLLIQTRRSLGLRTRSHTYAEHDTRGDLSPDEFELYDLRRDPYQLRNSARLPRARETRKALAERLDELRDCAAATCR